ncbi:uncharacterized protein F4812DRAFT_376206 [Daldinia caldariorum]|uniref:uncharacterized protein n=1 Tax=Daldinia caldariorum TaxID=326644 RepID=UPI00200886CF|nr:uncharacterized protein F4812DRAFT_376206 [Daldinia caldariorum]KAI1467778.1 hypothetical protein F4812DRAFT_376206 [Daldinia caldariorum]
MNRNVATAKHVGAQLLGDIEEGSLEELLNSLRLHPPAGSSTPIRPNIPIPALANIATRHHKAAQSTPPPVLSVSGRYLPFLYHLISSLIAEPHTYAVVVVDAERRFDVSRLVGSRSPSSYPARLDDLRHVYVCRPARARDQVRAAVQAAGEWMLYGAHGSRGRELWGTVVIGGGEGGGGGGGGGGASVKGDVHAGWKGWLRVEREEVEGFPAGASVEEALRDRDRRQEVVEDAGWVASSKVGSYLWRNN